MSSIVAVVLSFPSLVLLLFSSVLFSVLLSVLFFPGSKVVVSSFSSLFLFKLLLSLLFEFTAVGIGTAIANAILNGDDEEYNKLPYYYKNNYYQKTTEKSGALHQLQP